jgi:glyoxylase-like metal-dependent hydrolase (beta-lactamase superfamily II)
MTQIESSRPCSAAGRDGRKVFRPDDPPYAEVRWADPQGTGTSSYDLLPGVPKNLDRYVTRLIARNASVMTGPGTNTYLIGEHELAVLDPGPDEPAHIKAILAAGAGRIRWIVCTHTHRDHSSAVAAIRDATGASVVGRPAPDTDHDTRLVVDRVLADGDSLQCDGFSLRAVFTPGHASNHLCYLLDKTRMLFTGDHIIQGSTVVIWPPDGNMSAYLHSLERLLTLDITVLAPGHGYLIGRPHAEAERLIRHRLTREDKVRRALLAAGGSAQLETLLPLVYDDVPAAIHPIAARSLQAHLEKLIADGEVSHTGGHYSRGERKPAAT